MLKVISISILDQHSWACCLAKLGLVPGGALGYFLGGYVQPGTPNWHPVLKKNSPKIDTPFYKRANFLYPVLEFALKLDTRSINEPIFYIPF